MLRALVRCCTASYPHRGGDLQAGVYLAALPSTPFSAHAMGTRTVAVNGSCWLCSGNEKGCFVVFLGFLSEVPYVSG